MAADGRLSIVSAERIRDELDKLIVVDHPAAGLWFAIDTGLAGEFLPELPAMRLEQDPIHRHKDVLTHTLAVVDNVRPPASPAAFDYRITRLAALFHDVGKPRTRGYQAGKGVTFHHHDAVGGDPRDSFDVAVDSPALPVWREHPDAFVVGQLPARAGEVPADRLAVDQQRRNRLAELPDELAVRAGLAVVDLRALGMDGRDHGFIRRGDRVRYLRVRGRCREDSQGPSKSSNDGR